MTGRVTGVAAVDFLASVERAGGPAGARLREALAGRRLRVGTGRTTLPLVALRANGFTVEATGPAPLPGCVGLWNGKTQLGEGLVVLTARDGDLLHYEFKRWTETAEGPARDWAEGAEAGD